MWRRRDYVEALEEERRKILVFQRELPLSLDLVDQAWPEFTLPECSEEQTSSDAPAFEKFIIKPPSFSQSDGEDATDNNDDRNLKKSDWLDLLSSGTKPQIHPTHRYIPSGEKLYVFDAATKYKSAGQDTIILAGAEYGSGSSRDWATKGPMPLGVKAVIAKSFERIHRSNLIGMGIVLYVSSLARMQTH